MTPLLQMNNVSRIHGAGHTQVVALSNVSFELQPGELVAIMGPSGSGKSTLLALAGGLDAPTAGTVEIGGQNVASLKRRSLAHLRRRRVGYVFQQFNLIDGLTALENVALPLELDGVSAKDATSAAVRALASVGLTERADHFPQDLSGGEQQRVAIARATVGERELILADEPTGALDTVTGDSVMHLLRDHTSRGGGAVLVTHDARLAAWAHRIISLRDGRLVGESIADSAELLLEGVN
jgi:putative ABC transport system ATP-binding protein